MANPSPSCSEAKLRIPLSLTLTSDPSASLVRSLSPKLSPLLSIPAVAIRAHAVTNSYPILTVLPNRSPTSIRAQSHPKLVFRTVAKIIFKKYVNQTMPPHSLFKPLQRLFLPLPHVQPTWNIHNSFLPFIYTAVRNSFLYRINRE